MRLKSFYAQTMTEAMQMVRDTLGDEAVIVASREERGGHVHVTAAIEPAFEVGGNGLSPNAADDWLQYDDENDEGSTAEELTDILLRHSVPEDVIDHIISCATVVGLGDPASAMTASIEHLFAFRPLPRQESPKPFMMVGPPGAGKTLAVAKMAARSVMDGLDVAAISCDTVRAGGYEQLEAFTKLLRIPLYKAKTPGDLAALYEDLQPRDHIIVDTAGINPFDTDQIKDLAQLIGAAECNAQLVIPAGCDADEAGEMGRIFSTLGVYGLLPTRIDMARRLGALFSAAYHGTLAFSDAGNTPKVADGLITLTPDSLTQLLVPSIKRRAGQTGH